MNQIAALLFKKKSTSLDILFSKCQGRENVQFNKMEENCNQSPNDMQCQVLQKKPVPRLII